MKKEIVLPTVLLGVLLVAVPGARSAQAQEKKSYPLVCRGGGTIYKTLKTDPVTYFAGFHFKKGARSADSGLEAGECSWLDRGMSEREPDAVTQAPEAPDRKGDFGWISKLQGADSYWVFNVYNSGTIFVVTDSKPYRGKTVDSSRPAFEALVTRPQTESAGITETAPVAILERDTNRPGLDFKSFEVADVPELCRQACDADPQCKAFTFVKPGLQGRRAMCWLKSGVPAASTSDCCVSGVKSSKTSGR